MKSTAVRICTAVRIRFLCAGTWNFFHIIKREGKEPGFIKNIKKCAIMKNRIIQADFQYSGSDTANADGRRRAEKEEV